MKLQCPPGDPASNKGVAYAAVGITLQVVAILTVILRLYSRLVLTRSAGSDDVAIVLAVAVSLAGDIGEVIGANHGFGRHCSAISSENLKVAIKFLYIDWVIAFIAFFLVRTSVMLFTLRLMPRVKRKSAMVIYVLFGLNFAITLYAATVYGVSCTPFSASWDPKPGAKCISPKFVSSAQIANGVLSSIIDIATAMVPAFLLWKVKMKRQTKIILDTIFGLGILTAGLSIVRAVASPYHALVVDPTWALLTANFACSVEGKAGCILASAPALRQMFAYWRRTGTLRPTGHRQRPNSDFGAMRHRVNVRDIFWRGKQDPVRAQGLTGDEKRKLASTSDDSMKTGHTSVPSAGGEDLGYIGMSKDVFVHPEDSPLDNMEKHASYAVGARGSAA